VSRTCRSRRADRRSPFEGLAIPARDQCDGRLTDEQQFRDIVIKTGAEGEVVRLSDVARVELGAQEYAIQSLLNNKNAVAIPVFQAPNSNALQLSQAVSQDDGGAEEGLSAGC